MLEKRKIINGIIFILSIFLGLFFIYQGITKHWISPCNELDLNSSVPVDYQNIMKILCNSGFTITLGAFEVLAGILIMIPYTRLLGAIMLLPIIFNIFAIHFFIDNRADELVETGIPLLINFIIILYYYPRLKKLLGTKKQVY